MVSGPYVKNLSFFIVSCFIRKIFRKTEFFKLRQIESWKEAQEIPERAELTEWIALMLLEEDA